MDKITSEPCKLLRHSRVISQKWYASQSDEGRMYWSERQWHETLLKSKKWQHLSEDEASHIANILANHPDEKRQVKRLYKLSESTLRRLIIKTKLIDKAEDAAKYSPKSLNPLSQKAQRLIEEYLSPSSESKTISMAKKQIEFSLGEINSEQKIKSFVNKEMKFAYKKGSSRPPRYATRCIQTVKFLF